MKLSCALTFVTLSMVCPLSEAGRRNLQRGGGRGGRNNKGEDSIFDDYGGKKGAFAVGKKGGYGDGGYGGKKGGYGTNDCDVCNRGRPEEITITYSSDGQNSIYQPDGKASCRSGEYPNPAFVKVGGSDDIFELEDGDTITVSVGSGAETYFEFVGSPESDCFIHTSCSYPIVEGDQIGPWIVGDGSEECEPPKCVVCDRNHKKDVDELTLRYNINGKNSEYQDSSKASCREGLFPDDTRIQVNGDVFNLSNGDVFTITPDGGAETYLNFLDDSSDTCFIHTSCSVPIVPGDQIGPFEVVGDSECFIEDSCIEATVRTDDDGDTVIDVVFDYSDLSADRTFVDNCDSRDGDCPITDFSAASSDWIGFYPCEAANSDPPFRVEPTLWSFTCYDQEVDGRKGVCRRSGVPISNGTITFDKDTVPAFSSTGVYQNIDEIMADGGGCYVVLLNRIDGFSAPPYYNLCLGNEITIPSSMS